MRKVVGAALSLLLVLGAAGCRWRPPAATVDGHPITAQNLQDDIGILTDHPDLADVLYGDLLASDPRVSAFVKGAPESRDGQPTPSTLTSNVLTGRIFEQLFADAYERSGKKLSAEQEAAQRASLTDQLRSILGSQEKLDSVPASYVDRIVGRAVHAQALLDGVEDAKVNDTVAALLSAGTVTIDPRYGTWDGTAFKVINNPAPGFEPAPSESSSTSSPSQQ